MFERNRIDNKPEAASVPVEIELQSGEQAKGKLKVPAGLTPIDALNGNGTPSTRCHEIPCGGRVSQSASEDERAGSGT